MKTILPWILAVVFAAGAGALYLSNSSKSAALSKAQDQVAQVDTMRTQLDELQKQAASQNEQIAAMRKDNEELLRLRSQVRQLNDEKAQMAKQVAASQAQVDRSQAEVQQVQARTAESAKAIAEQQILQMKQNQAVVNTCVNNLRLIQAAKQQWATDNNKQADALPTPTEIAPYFQNSQFPQCPGGGRYTLNAVGTAPTCSIAGHVLQ